MVEILLVDDDQINAKIFSKRLEKRGFSTTVVNSGQEALNYINEEKMTIVLLDIIMPEMDGTEVLRILRKKYPPTELPVIMLTAKDEVELIVDCLEAGASDYLTKPVNIDIAIARINTQLDLLNLYSDSMKKKQLETLNSMVATYNHQINNPLTVALGLLKREFDKLDESKVQRAVNSLERIAGIVKQIENITASGQIEEQTYVNDSKMIKLGK